MYIAYDSRILEILCSHCARPYIVQYYQFPDKNQMCVNLSTVHFITYAISDAIHFFPPSQDGLKNIPTLPTQIPRQLMTYLKYVLL